jgi:hypothetical protein
MNAFTLSPLVVGGVVAATLAVVVLLYLLRPPARHFFVSSNLIWQKVLETTRRVSDRWRWWLSGDHRRRQCTDDGDQNRQRSATLRTRQRSRR